MCTTPGRFRTRRSEAVLLPGRSKRAAAIRRNAQKGLVRNRLLLFVGFKRKITPMKGKTKALTIDEAVTQLAAITEPDWSKSTNEQKAEKLRNFGRVISALKKKKRAKRSKSSPIPRGRRRALGRG
jgi:hypothetical protein